MIPGTAAPVSKAGLTTAVDKTFEQVQRPLAGQAAVGILKAGLVVKENQRKTHCCAARLGKHKSTVVVSAGADY